MAGANQVSLPIERVFEALEKFTDERTHATVKLEICLLPNAPEFVRMIPTSEQEYRADKSANPFRELSDNDRQAERAMRRNGLRSMICNVSHKLFVFCPVTVITA